MTHNTKSQAKRMGVKSTLAYGDKKLAITAFGKGNNAEIAVQTNAKGVQTDAEGNEFVPTHTLKRFTVNRIDAKIGLERGELDSLLNNPAEAVGEDYLKLKGTLEKEFFDKEFPNDNVRIQIIHNILDIQKIIGLYVNDVIYSVNNLQDLPDYEDVRDVLGLSMGDAKIKENLTKIEPYLGFFGDAFQLPPKQEKNGKIVKVKETEAMRAQRDTYNKAVLRILGAVRQITEHFKYSHVLFSKYDDLKKELQKSVKIDWSIIETNYAKRMDTINDGFMKNSKMNLRILFDMLDAKYDEEKVEIAEEYYRFRILKEGKNLGVSMKKLREVMINKFRPEVKEKQHDSYRAKLYAITDYLLFRNLHNSSELESMVAVLRETADNDEKEELYNNFAQTAWENVKDLLVPFFKKFDGNFPAFSTDDLPNSLIENVKMSANKAVPFVQLLAFLCHFMDGKEINELLSAYIHKFENIQAFINTLKSLGESVKFSKEYALFDDYGGKRAGEIARQLRVLVSIGKMEPDLDGAKRVLYKAAIETLGVPDKSEYVTDEWLEANVLLDRSDKDAYAKNKKDANPFRNFIAGNVISSRRFMYLVRYTKPKTVQAVMSNRKIVRYVLTRLSEFNDGQQIDRYFGNINDSQKPDVSMPVKIDSLTDKLTGLSFESLVTNKAGIIADSREKNPRLKNVAIERLKALVGLYLTVAFIAIKNLVKANARYYIAFAAFERDHAMFVKKLKATPELLTKSHLEFEDKDGKKQHNEAFSLTEYFLDREDENDYKPAHGQPFDKEACRKHLDSIQRHFTKKWRDILRQQIVDAKRVSATGLLLSKVRNDAAHLNVLTALPNCVKDFRKGTHGEKMQSYFELYHFLIQKLLCADSGLQIPAEYKRRVDAGVPCSDLVHAAYVSLGYNLARYKSLTIEALFDEDSESGKARIEKQKRKETDKQAKQTR